MFIESIDLENIACYRKNTFEFSNLAVVYGENRSGKSSLVYALFFGLFGEHLNPSLTGADLCRKGSADGSATVIFRNEEGRFQLRRATSGASSLRRFSSEHPEDPWVATEQEWGKPVDVHVGVPAAVAALTSFFQEGELILFLREMPKYSRTLLQHIMRMDEVFIVQSRLKKCLTLAREHHLQAEQRRSAEASDTSRMSDAAGAAETLESQLAVLQREHQELLRQGSDRPDPERYLHLKHRYETTEREARLAREAREQRLPFARLAEEKEAIEERIAQTILEEGRGADLQNRIGAISARISDAAARKERLTSLKESPLCPTCGQPIPGERMAESVDRLTHQIRDWESERQSIQKDLTEWNLTERALQTDRRRMEEIRFHMSTAERVEQEYKRLEQESVEAREALERFESQTPTGDLSEAENRLASIREVENQISILQKRLIDAKVAAAQYVDAENRRKMHEAEITALERERLICHVTHRAVEDAVQSLNRELMGRVRESLSYWTDHFSFLEAFDIGLTPTQLSPIIQAKGYPYKLNQMSKSERIFLYLMLKLAIGDALSHLGVFVLDDPADGLDEKRKRMMAELTKEISMKRQVLITTNDPGFAHLFAPETRIDLTT
jgi:DNA repair exonuclease SbcCD ATPase subunit